MSTLITRKKKMGRPKVESEEARSRIQQPLLGELDAWAAMHDITRAEAIRCLIQKGLEVEVFQKEVHEETPR